MQLFGITIKLLIMRKTLLLFLTLFTAFYVSAQIATPEELTPGYNFRLTKDVPSQSLNPDHVSGKTQNSFVSPAFDTTWANRFQTVLDSTVAATGVKGASAAMLVPGQGLWTGVSGISSEDVPITSEMRFGFASNTKLYIAVTLAKLQEEGVLSLDDPLYQWLPAYAFVDSTTTIRQMLSHQSGIFDFWNDQISFFWNLILSDTSHFFTHEEVLATIGDPHFVPGNGYSYSNTNYLLAGLVIEAATEKSWIQKLHEVIFDPLNMDSTFVGTFEPRNGPVANEWVINQWEDVNTPMTSAYTAINSAGAIFSTPQEMVAWYWALFNGDIISEASLEEILDFETTSDAGLGIFEVSFNNHHLYVHSGAMPGYLSQMAFDVETKSVYCVATNARNINFTNIVVPLINVLFNDAPRKENDAGISEIVSPWESSCNDTVSPLVTMSNFGSGVLTSANINYQIDNGSISTFSWTGSLDPGKYVSVALPDISIPDGFHQFTAYTSMPNGLPEGYNYNDTTKSNFIVNTSASVITSLYESFDSDVFPPEGWTLNSSAFDQWGQTNLVRYSGDGCVAKSNYDDPNYASYYDLTLPKIHISAGTDAILGFTYAYAMSPGGFYDDTLQVLVSNDCGVTWEKFFDKGGLTLITNSNVNGPFYPQSTDQWKGESILIDAYPNDVLIRFRAINGASNNLFIDDVSVSLITSLEETTVTENYKVYPNPATDELTISGLPINSAIQITDLAGNLLMTRKSGNEITTIDISKLPNGLYIIRTTMGVQKIVKM